MKIGYPNHPRKNLVSEIHRIKELGFEFVDLFLESDEAEYGNFNVMDARNALDETGLDTVGHIAWYLPTGSPMKRLREASVEIAKEYFDVFRDLNCKYVTIHAYWHFVLFSAKENMEFQTETLQNLVPYARDRGLTIVYEPINSSRDSMENMKKMMEMNPGVEFHADIGHLNLFGKDPVTCLEVFRDQLKHVHLHDNDGTGDQHLAMGRGNIDLPGVIKCLKSFYDGTITLEIFNESDEVLRKNIEMVKSLWEKY